VGQGMTATIRAWGTDRVIKHYHDPCPRLPSWERDMTLQARRLGLPAPRVDELITVDGRPALVMERLHGLSAAYVLRHHPQRSYEVLEATLDLWERLWAAEIPPSGHFPRINTEIARRISSARVLSSRHKQLLIQRLEEITQHTVLCHGDLQPSNILFTQKGPMLLDWLDFSLGDPTADLARCLLTCHLGDPEGHFTRLFTQLRQAWYTKSGANPIYLEGWLRITAAAYLADPESPHHPHLHRIATGAEDVRALVEG